MRDAVQELSLMMRSRHPLIVVRTVEDDRATTLLRMAAERADLPVFVWSRTRGLSRVGVPTAVYQTEAPEAALRHVATSSLAAIYHFPRLADGLQAGTAVEAELVDAVKAQKELGGTLFLTGPSAELPPAIDHLATVVPLPGPSEDELRDLLSRLIRDLSDRQHLEIALSRAETETLVQQLRGLTLLEAEKILTKAMIEDNRLSVSDLEHVVEAKRAVIEQEGLLEYYPLESALTEVADLVRLKEWLSKRSAVVRDPGRAKAFGLEFPRGILLLGVPGCGKSLCAKAVAAEWRLPLLKLDPSNLYNKYIGESERNFKRAMAAAERMSPVVLWIDEIEKAFASGGSEDGGVSQRILGTFLSWMQERRGDVFIVATANQIRSIPPELLRKGRFDEIFFVDLPPPEVRTEILRIHLGTRGQEPGGFDLQRVAARTEGFSGAELEQVVVAGLFTAFSNERPLTTESLLAEVAATVPLATSMAERIHDMRVWARERAAPAN